MTEFDDHMYRGSTPLHWLQNKSILPFETINERKSVFIFTSGVVFMWPLLFGAHEIVALTFFWLSFPATILLLYYSFFKNKIGQKLSYFFILSLICSPLIFYYFTNSLMQELWLAPVLLSYVVCLQKLLIQKKITKNLIIICAISLAILVSIKINTIIYALLILPLIFKKGFKIFPFLFNFAKIFLITVMLGGYLFVAVKNLYSLGSPMGSPYFVKTHGVVLSAQQIYTHLVRIPFVFFDPPLFGVESAQGFSSAVNSLAIEVGATKILEGEDVEVWISKFEYRNNWPNTRFGLLGILVFCLSIYVIYKQTNTLLSVFFVLIVAQLIFIRWAEGSGLPYRQLISVFPSLLLLLGISLKKSKLEKILTTNVSLIVITVAMVGTVLIGSQRLILMKRDFTNYKSIKSENILIIEEQDTPDYSYFFLMVVFAIKYSYLAKEIGLKILS